MSEDAKRFRIYTRTGDSGTSSLYTGQRLPKDCSFFEALGDVDELNCAVGLAREFVQETCEPVAQQLAEVQSRLLDVGSAVATPTDPTNSAGVKVKRTRFDPVHSTTLEAQMDDLDTELPPLRNFILPSGGKAASALHVARAVCRRAERSVVALARTTTSPDNATDSSSASTLNNTNQQAQQKDGGEEGHGPRGADVEAAKAGIPPNSVVDSAVVVYVNRLSDYLFTAARYLSYKEGRPEVTYQKGMT